MLIATILVAITSAVSVVLCPLSAPLVAVSAKGVASLVAVTCSPLPTKSARPPTHVLLVVPLRVGLPGGSERITLPAKLISRYPLLLRASRTGWVVNGLPDTTSPLLAAGSLGSVVNTICVAIMSAVRVAVLTVGRLPPEPLG